MSTISAMPSSIVTWLSGRSELSEIKFLTEYPPRNKAVPLKSPIVSVGLNDVKITDHFTDNGEGVLVADEYCRKAAIEIRLGIHVPFSQGGSACHEVFTKVVDCLTFETDLNIICSECHSIVSDRDTDALVMDALITLETDFCPAEETDENYQCFLDKTLLCGSHIRDATIHITPEERERWNERYVFDMYLGNGSTSRTVNIGFQPDFVCVFRSGANPLKYDSVTGKTLFNMGFALGVGGTYGLETTQNGFKVKSGNSQTLDNCVPYLNEAGSMYAYFALKPVSE